MEPRHLGWPVVGVVYLTLLSLHCKHQTKVVGLGLWLSSENSHRTNVGTKVRIPGNHKNAEWAQWPACHCQPWKAETGDCRASWLSKLAIWGGLEFDWEKLPQWMNKVERDGEWLTRDISLRRPSACTHAHTGSGIRVREKMGNKAMSSCHPIRMMALQNDGLKVGVGFRPGVRCLQSLCMLSCLHRLYGQHCALVVSSEDTIFEFTVVGLTSFCSRVSETMLLYPLSSSDGLLLWLQTWHWLPIVFYSVTFYISEFYVCGSFAYTYVHGLHEHGSWYLRKSANSTESSETRVRD